MLNPMLISIVTGIISLIVVFQYGYKYNQSPNPTPKPVPTPTLTPQPTVKPTFTVKPTIRYQNNDSLEFNGYECIDDCSGHEAGYEWAEENGITQDDVDNYSGNSNSFMEGMQSYVDENY